MDRSRETGDDRSRDAPADGFRRGAFVTLGESDPGPSAVDARRRRV